MNADDTTLNLDVINELTEILGDDLSSIYQEFIESTPSQLEAAKSAAIKKDTENLTVIIHSMKGAAGNIGLQKLYESCMDLETKLRNNNDVNTAEAITNIQNDYFMTLATLRIQQLID